MEECVSDRIMKAYVSFEYICVKKPVYLFLSEDVIKKFMEENSIPSNFEPNSILGCMVIKVTEYDFVGIGV
jgi:hypothetical protein